MAGISVMYMGGLDSLELSLRAKARLDVNLDERVWNSNVKCAYPTRPLPAPSSILLKQTVSIQVFLCEAFSRSRYNGRRSIQT